MTRRWWLRLLPFAPAALTPTIRESGHVFHDSRGAYTMRFLVDLTGRVLREGWRDLRTGEIGWIK